MAARLALTQHSTTLIRARLDVELPALSGDGRRALDFGEEAAARAEWREAVVHYLHARQLHAQEPALHFLAGLAFVHLSRLDHAQEALNTAAKALEQRKKQGSAQGSAQQGPAVARLLCAVLVALGNVNARLTTSPGMSSHKVLQRAFKASTSDALRVGERSFVLASLASLQSLRHADARAEDNAKEALALEPNNAFAMHVLGMVHMRRRNYAKAQDVLKEAVRVDNHTSHQRLLVQCIWSQYEGHEPKEAPVQAYAALTRAFPRSEVFSSALVIANANAKKYTQAVKESTRTMGLFTAAGPADTALRGEVLAVRFVCLFAQSHYVQAASEMVQSTDAANPISAACLLVVAVCLVVLGVLSAVFGCEGCIIGLFGLVLLVLRGVFSMLLLSAIGSIYHSIEGEPFPVPNALMLMF